ncbi:MAG: G8 domain-containing protein [Pseudomonadota bacterium]
MENGNHAMHTAQANRLANPDDATHVAIKSGDWSDPSTWEGGRVPGSEAKVHVPEGVSVVYDVDSDVPLDTVRVDGHLTWATDQHTEMLVETIVTSHGSLLEVGSVNNAINDNVDAVITFRDTPINTGQDPDQLSHGLVAFGEVNVQGAEKESHLTIDGRVDRGDRSIEVEGDLSNWEIGDTIVIIGTGDGSRDEERTITGISGDTITFDRALSYSHNPPDGMDFDTFVGNLSRNVTFQSEDASGVRGHVMLHNDMGGADGVANSIQYAAFEDLGRTDSSIITGTASNPTGRYPLHLHEIGTEPDSAISNLIGNAVNGSPGWGITHHSSHAAVNHNFVYDTVGSGIISEMGDETGEWVGNLVSSVDGDGVVKSGGSGHPIPGSEGAAYENQSRVILQQDNVAANAKIGWNFSGREDFEFPSTNDGVHRKMFDREQVPFDPSPFDAALDHEEPAIVNFDDNTVIGSSTGLRVFHRQYSDDTDVMSVFKNFDVWGGGDAVHLDNYSSNYQFMDSVWQGDGVGFRIERKTSSAVFNDVEFHDFDTAYQSFGINHEVVLIDTTFHGVDTRFDLKDLMKNVSDNGTRNDLINYFRQEYGIDYENPMPQIVNSSNLTEIDQVEFTLDPGADLTIGPSNRTIEFTGTIRDSVGVRNFNEYAIAATPNGNNNVKGFEGIDIFLGKQSQGRQIHFQPEELVAEHGSYQKADGSWVTPIVNWVTDRLTGDQHPIIIEIKLEGFDNATLAQYELDSYPNPQINNPQWFRDNTGTAAAQKAAQQGNSGHDSHNSVDQEPSTGHSVDHQMQDDDAMDDMADDQHAGDDDGHAMPADDSTPTTSGETDADDHDSEDHSDADHQSGPALVPTHEGGDGRDRLRGDEGDNVIFGQANRDRLYGGDGDDVLNGGSENDHLFGGSGADRFVDNDDSVDDIHDFNIAEGDLLDLSEVADRFGLSSAEMEAALNLRTIGRGVRVELDVEGVSHSLVVIRGVQADVLRKAAPWILSADGTSVGPTPTESQEASQVDDSAVQAGPTPVETPVAETPVSSPETGGVNVNATTLLGNSGNNTLKDGDESTLIAGLGGRDEIYGGDGDDVIIGGSGRDKMTGDAGADTFVFGTATLDGFRDDVYDFDVSEGDKIDLSEIAEAYGLSEDEMIATIDLQKIKPGLKIQLELDGTSHKVAVLHGLDNSDVAAVEDSLIL